MSRFLLLMLFLVAAEGRGGRAKRASVDKEEDDFAEFDVADEDWDDDREATLINAPSMKCALSSRSGCSGGGSGGGGGGGGRGGR